MRLRVRVRRVRVRVKSDLGSADMCWWHQGCVTMPNTKNIESLGHPKFKGSINAHSAAHSDGVILCRLQKRLEVVHELGTSGWEWDWDGDWDWDWDWEWDWDWDAP